MNELKHYGILGMKWGVRRTPEQLGHRKEKKDDFRRKDPKNMTDDELRKNLNRLQMEKQFESLAKKKSGKGKEFAQRALTTIGMMGVAAVGKAVVDLGKNFVNGGISSWNDSWKFRVL